MAAAERIEIPLPRRLPEAALRDLVAGFPLRREPTERRELRLVDSFDWRLHRAGLRAVHDGRELALEDAAGAPRGRCPAPPPPLLAHQLAEPVAGRIGGLLGIRALVPAAGLRVARSSWRVHNDDAKTVAYLAVEERQFLDGDGGRTLRPERVLVLEGVRGYRGPFKALRKALETGLGAGREATDPLDRALAACPRRPGEGGGTPELVLTPGQRADAAMKAILARLLATMEENQGGMLANHDSEFLHDYRVAVRRTRSALAQVKGVFPASVTERFKAEFGWLGALTSPARDMDVYLLALPGFRELLEPAHRDHLDTLEAFLEERRATEYRHLVSELGKARYRRLLTAWSGFLNRPLARRPTAPAADHPVKAVADRRVWKMYRRVMKEGQAITADSPPDDLHELRKSCKKLRYLMEFFASLYPAKDIGGLIKALKQFQDNLGDYQDLSVQMEHLAGFEEELARQGRLDDAARAAIEQLVARLEARRGEVRGEFDGRFADFSEDKVQQAFGGLFHAAAD